jgi:hypothetical protein
LNYAWCFGTNELALSYLVQSLPMSTQPEFSVESIDGSRLGKLSVPVQKAADWINFLVSPKQGAQIISARQGDAWLTLYFQGDEGLYAYLDGRFNCQIGFIHPENVFIGQGLK